MLFPRLVYKSANVHKAVTSEAERAAALTGGWYDSVPEALAGAHAAPPAPAPKLKPAADVVAEAAKAAQVAEILADLKGKDANAQREYALALGLKIDKKAESPAILDAIEKALAAA